MKMCPYPAYWLRYGPVHTHSSWPVSLCCLQVSFNLNTGMVGPPPGSAFLAGLDTQDNGSRGCPGNGMCVCVCASQVKFRFPCLAVYP